MKTFYQSYIRAFMKFAQTSLENQKYLKMVSVYALILNDKANELIKRAALNSMIDLPKLRREIYQLGVEYIHKFCDKIRSVTMTNNDLRRGNRS